MQGLGLVRISKKQIFVVISHKGISECKKMGLGPKSYLDIQLVEYNLNAHWMECFYPLTLIIDIR